MLNTNKLEELRKGNRYSKVRLAELLGISDTTYDNLCKSGDFRAKAIKEISKLFNVSVGYLFDETEINLNKSEVNLGNKPKVNYSLENEMLKKRVSDLEDIIAAKDEIIELLKKGN